MFVKIHGRGCMRMILLLLLSLFGLLVFILWSTDFFLVSQTAGKSGRFVRHRRTPKHFLRVKFKRETKQTRREKSGVVNERLAAEIGFAWSFSPQTGYRCDQQWGIYGSLSRSTGPSVVKQPPSRSTGHSVVKQPQSRSTGSVCKAANDALSMKSIKMISQTNSNETESP